MSPPVTITQAAMDGIAAVLRDRPGPPNPSLVASAFCANCGWRRYNQDGIHGRAMRHRSEAGHQVVVVETLTTTYEAATNA